MKMLWNWNLSVQKVLWGEMAGWHQRCNGHELGQTLEDGKGRGGLACCSSWGLKESDTTEWLKENHSFIGTQPQPLSYILSRVVVQLSRCNPPTTHLPKIFKELSGPSQRKFAYPVPTSPSFSFFSAHRVLLWGELMQFSASNLLPRRSSPNSVSKTSHSFLSAPASSPPHPQVLTTLQPQPAQATPNSHCSFNIKCSLTHKPLSLEPSPSVHLTHSRPPFGVKGKPRLYEVSFERTF